MDWTVEKKAPQRSPRQARVWGWVAGLLLGAGPLATANDAPLCDAGPDQVAPDPVDQVILTSDCSDADGTIVQYSWTQLNGPSVSLNGVDQPQLTVTNMKVGLYRFRLVVTDDGGLQASDEVVAFATGDVPAGQVSGELKTWHRVDLTVQGPDLDENSEPNPFLDHRMIAFFIHPFSDQSFRVAGHFAADGAAAESSATAGDVWRAHLCPNKPGTWYYWIQFKTGDDIAISEFFNPGTKTDGNRSYGSFEVGPSDKTGKDFRSKGTLRPVGERYLRFEGTREYFLKGGADSPENLLGYEDFDGTPNASHNYAPHLPDFNGGPTWQGGKGQSLLGALNYLSSTGMNSIYFLTMNRTGDGDDVWPWTGKDERLRFDVSKLDQWERIFSYMDEMGLMLHVVTQETENDKLLDGGSLGTHRRMYYRELISRFGHHLAITWNLGEENTNTAWDADDFFKYFRRWDPYQHNVVMHTFPHRKFEKYIPLLERGALTGASLQVTDMTNVHNETVTWVNEPRKYDINWVVTLDEIGPQENGVVPDSLNFWHHNVRQQALWGSLTAGGAGCEWYFGYQHPNDDLDCEDWRSREHMWTLTGHALNFFKDNSVRFDRMRPADDLTDKPLDWCLAEEGQAYVVYRFAESGEPRLDLGSSGAPFKIRWFDPRNGGPLQNGSVDSVTGPGWKKIGNPPSDPTMDWVVLIRSENRPPVIKRYWVGPNPLNQPEDLHLGALVEDPDGQDDVRVVFMFLWDNNQQPLGLLRLPYQGNNAYGIEFPQVTGLQPGTYAYALLAVDRSGKKSFGEVRPLEVR